MPIPQSILQSIEARSLALERFADAEVRKALAILQDLQTEILTQLRAIDPAGPGINRLRMARLRRLLTQTNGSIAGAYTRIGEVMEGALISVAEGEITTQTRLLARYLGPLRQVVSVNSVVTSPNILRQLVRNTAVNMGDAWGAAPMRDWLSQQGREIQARFALQINRGVQLGESIQEMTRRVIGSSGRSGVMEVARSTAEGLVRTSVQAITGEARRELYSANRDTLKGIYQITTEDDRTTVICLAYAGKAWRYDEEGALIPEGHSLQYQGGVPRHPNCRSIDAPWVASLEEMGIDPEEVPESARRIFDGKLPADKDGAFLLALRSEAQQLEMLGPSRLRMLRSGQVSLEDLVTSQGATRTVGSLTELVARRLGG